jgi:hypothetical protein
MSDKIWSDNMPLHFSMLDPASIDAQTALGSAALANGQKDEPRTA